uniref:HDC20074 n=1 Tax=Drosophila melanogaster TaxID=7227 RepID=Q6II15_DROME|nr:TPA_inf: HDC20074 [Drosophila melanogaster]
MKSAEGRNFSAAPADGGWRIQEAATSDLRPLTLPPIFLSPVPGGCHLRHACELKRALPAGLKTTDRRFRFLVAFSFGRSPSGA